ncbi:MAG: hypothetical protein ACREE0_15925 [Phenylobacterium sp.]
MNPAAVIVLALACAGCGRIAEGQAKRIGDLQVREATQGYEAARNRGDPLDMCVKAKLVAIAYADTRDLANSSAWKARETQDCRAAMDALHVAPPSGRPAPP